MYFFNRIKKYIVFIVLFTVLTQTSADSSEDLFRAAEWDNESALVALALREFDLNTPNEQGEYALTVALRNDAFKAFYFLLSQQSVRVELRNPLGESPLMMAALRGHLEPARRLIQRGAEVNKPGWTALHYAAARSEPDSVEMVRLLLKHHAYIDAESPNKTTPLMMAAHYGHRDVVRLLLQEGADASLRNEQGLSAMDFAQRAGRNDMLALVADALQPRVPER